MTNQRINEIAEKYANKISCHHEEWEGIPEVDATCKYCHKDEMEVAQEHVETITAAILEATEELRKDKERLDWLLKLEHRIVSIRTISPAERPGWRWQIEYGGIVTIPKIDGRTAIDSAMESERKK